MTPTPKPASSASGHPAAEQPQGAAGPFVLNLCSSTTPMALSNPEQAELKRFSFFVSRRFEEGRERFRLHMGYFATLAEAEEWLGAVRDIYPGAWAGEAPGKKLRERAVAAAAAQAQHAAGPPPHANVPTIHAPTVGAGAAVPVSVPIAKSASTVAPSASHQAAAAVSVLNSAPVAKVASAPSRLPTAAGGTSRAGTAISAVPAAVPVAAAAVAGGAQGSGVATKAGASQVAVLAAKGAAVQTAGTAAGAGAARASGAVAKADAAQVSGPAVKAGATQAAGTAAGSAGATRASGPAAKADAMKGGAALSAGAAKGSAAHVVPAAKGAQTQTPGSATKAAAAAPQAASKPAATQPAAAGAGGAPAGRAVGASGTRSKANAKGLPNSNVREVLKALEETQPDAEVTGETRMMPAPVMTGLDAAADDPGFSDTQVLKFLEARRADGTELSGVEAESGAISLLKPDDTATRRALKQAITDNAPVWFAVQLQWAVQPVELDKVPPLAIFSAYTLYTVEGSRDGRKWYGLRLGFFSDAISAKQVAYYVRSEFNSVAVVPVSPQEHDRASDIDTRAQISVPKKGGRSGPVDEFKLIDLDEPSAPIARQAPPRPVVPARTAPVAAAARQGTGKTNGRVRARERRAPQTLEETLEILGAGQLEMDNGTGETMNESGVRHLRVEVQKNTPFGRLLERLSERVRKP